MKQYIRTNGKIFDTSYRFAKLVGKDETIDLLNVWLDEDKKYIQADTIEELIEVGDLVGIFNGNIEKVNKTDFLDIRQEYQFYTNGSNSYWTDSDITELYTKQGNNYILVARKENGEWRIL